MGRWYLAYRTLGFISIAVTLLLASRLAAVLWATPSELWTVDFSPIAGLSQPPAARSIDWPVDPAVARVRIGNCVEQPGTIPESMACLEAIEYGLSTSPTSSELWLARAAVLARLGAFDDRFSESLVNSFATGPHEGWIAASRLPFALRMRVFLPNELIPSIGDDIQLVLTSRNLAGPLVAAYIADPFLRESTWDVIQQFATLGQQEQLIAWIRQEL